MLSYDSKLCVDDTYILLRQHVSLVKNFQCIHITRVFLSDHFHLTKMATSNDILYLKIINADSQSPQFSYSASI